MRVLREAFTPRSTRRTEAHADRIRAALDEAPDLTLEELKARLAAEGAAVSVTALWRFCRRHALTRKKVGPRGRAGPSRRRAGAPGVV